MIGKLGADLILLTYIAATEVLKADLKAQNSFW